MGAPTLLVRVHLNLPDLPECVVLTTDLAETVASLLRRLHAENRLPGIPGDWQLLHGVQVLPGGQRIGSLADAGAVLELTLIRAEPTAVSAPMAPAPVSASAPKPGSLRSSGIPSAPLAPAPTTAEFDLSADEDDELADSVDRAPLESMAMRAPAKYSQSAGPIVNRQATVRYYSRMNPARTFPLLVILSAEQIAEVKKKAVAQAVSSGFKVEAGSTVDIEPILPGCDCYPPREAIPVANEAMTATFWVVPHVLGRVQGARVVVRQNGAVLAEAPLEVKVSKQTLTVVFGLLGLVSPYLMSGLKAAKLDYDSQKADGFPLYRQAGEWALTNLSPSWLGVGLLAAAVVCYLWARPRRKDVFWDVAAKG